MKFLVQCAETGIADFIYKKSRIPPKWMNDKERKAWRIGYEYAKNLLV